MEQLFERLPQVRASILCSADGFNLCALGVDEYQVSRLAALNSSLYAVSGAAVEASSGSPRPLDFVTLVSGGQLCVLIAIAHPTRGHLLLCASAEDVRLGGLLYEVRTTAERLASLLLTDSEPVDA
jgi:predicted regulator of Ras-like GTPase activity (Roadblock/LC7/MglB family)